MSASRVAQQTRENLSQAVSFISTRLHILWMACAVASSTLFAASPRGQVVGWGDTAVSFAAPGSVFTNISSGGNHNLALTTDGNLVAWGANEVGQANLPVGLSNIINIAACYDHSLALKADSKVVGWGENYSGQATPPSHLSNVVAIAG